MARMARVVVPGVAHHVTQRGNRRQKTFFGVHDYKTYIDLLAKYCRKANTEVWAYCLMPNHVHLVLVPHTTDGLRMALGEAHRHYTRYINFRAQWRGHLWQERFHSFPMDENDLLSSEIVCDENLIAKHSRTGRPLGDSKFVKNLETITGRRLSVLKPGPKAIVGG